MIYSKTHLTLKMLSNSFEDFNLLADTSLFFCGNVDEKLVLNTSEERNSWNKIMHE